MEVSSTWFVVAALAVWRVTHLLVAEDGPGRIFARLRAALSSGFWRALFGCFYCLSIWIALPFAVGFDTYWVERLILWLALSGAACLLERIGQGAGAPPPAVYYEGDNEESHVLLRRSAPGNGSRGA